MSNHERELTFRDELPGLQASAAANTKAEAEHEKARRSAAEQQRVVRDLAVAVVSQLEGEAARYVAARLQDATYGQVAAFRLVLEALEDLGAKFPAGSK